MIKNILYSTFIITTITTSFLVSPIVVSAAEIYIDTTKKVLNSSDTIIANVRIGVKDECINTTSVDLVYDPTLLEVVDVSKGESLITLWIEGPEVDEEKGIVHFAGGIPGGYCGRVIGDPELSNILGRVIFTTVLGAVNPGEENSSVIAIASSSQVLLNNGIGTPAPLIVGSVELGLTYTGGAVVNDWLQTIRADVIAPEVFTVAVQRNDSMYGGKYFIAFSTIDKQTGVNHYEVLETNPSLFGFDILTNRQIHWKEAQSPYMLWDQSISSKVLVKAVDEAGNERIATFDPPGTTPFKIILIELLQLTVVVGVIIGFIYLIYKSIRNNRRNIIEESEHSESEE